MATGWTARGLVRVCAVLVSVCVVVAVIPAPAPGEDTPLLTDEEQERLKGASEVAAKAVKAGYGNGDTEAVVSIGVMAAGPYGAALAVAWSVFKMIAKPSTPDPFGLILRRLDQLDADIRNLRRADVEIRARQVKHENEERLEKVRRLRDDLRALLRKLNDVSPDAQRKRDLATEAARIADEFLVHFLETGSTVSIWKLSDLKKDGSFKEPPDFRPHPALESYILALATWIRALTDAYRGDLVSLQRNYRSALEKHAEILSVRVRWNDSRDEPRTIPEHIMARVVCPLGSHDTYSDRNGNCALSEHCQDDLFGLRLESPSPPIVHYVGKNMLCTWPANTAKSSMEEGLEVLHGTGIAAHYAGVLRHVAKWGATPGEQYIGQFVNTRNTRNQLYAVSREGVLTWLGHQLGTDYTLPQAPLSIGKKKSDSPGPAGLAGTRIQGQVERADPRLGASTAAPQERQLIEPARPGVQSRAVERAAPVTQAGSLPPLRQPRKPGEVVQNWEPATRVGTGWQHFRAVIPAGLGSLYALTADGVLKWYYHDGYMDGSPRWQGPVDVGTGWQGFKQIVPGGEGVLYAILPDGRLRWFRHADYRAAKGPSGWAPSRDVGTGWAHFTHVFSAGYGVLYAVNAEGQVRWYRHKGYQTGTLEWEGPKIVQVGWTNFKRVFSAGEGDIYGITQGGELVWTRHGGWQTGEAFRSWWKPLVVATGWDDHVHVFATMPGPHVSTTVR